MAIIPKAIRRIAYLTTNMPRRHDSGMAILNRHVIAEIIDCQHALSHADFESLNACLALRAYKGSSVIIHYAIASSPYEVQHNTGNRSLENPDSAVLHPGYLLLHSPVFYPNDGITCFFSY
jgi:hypothetical protein